MLVRDRMSSPPLSVSPGDSYHAALELMQEHRAHHIPVVENGRVVGILAERDLLLAAVNYMQADIDVADIMQSPVVTTTPDTSMADAARSMVEHRIGGLPVVDADQTLVGVVTETDVVNAFVEAMSA